MDINEALSVARQIGEITNGNYATHMKIQDALGTLERYVAEREKINKEIQEAIRHETDSSGKPSNVADLRPDKQ